VFDEVSDPVVRSNILYFMALGKDPTSHKAFLYNVFAKHAGDQSIIISAIRSLTALYNQDVGSYNIFFRYIARQDRSIRSAALSALASSPYVWRDYEEIRSRVLKSDDPNARRALLGRVAITEGPRYVEAAFDAQTRTFLDFGVAITHWKLRTGAEKLLIAKKRIASNDYRQPIFIDESELAATVEQYRTRLKTLRTKYNIPISFGT